MFRARNLITLVAVFALVAGLAFVTVSLSPSRQSAVPVQRTGTAAGFPRRTSASADTGRVVNGKFVSGSAPAPRQAAGPVATSPTRVKGAVPAATKPKAVKLPVHGKSAPETVRVLKPGPLPTKAGYSPKTSRQLPLTRANQVTYANADGTKTAFQYAEPVNFRRADGTWAPISTTLVSAASSAAGSPDTWSETPVAATPSSSPSLPPSASVSPSPSASLLTPAGTASPTASPTISPLPAPSAAPASGWTEKSEASPESFSAQGNAPSLVSVPVDGGHRVAFGIDGANAVTGSASGNTVTYPGVRNDSSAKFSAGTGTMKESIVLSSSSAPLTWVFPLTLTGLKAKMGPGGVIEFTDSSGTVRAYVPRGFMTDSKIDPHSGNGAKSFGVKYSLVTSGGRQAIKMTLDTAWLDSKDRVYPVTVDPSVDDATVNGSTYVLTPYDNDYSSDTELDVGTYDGGSNVAKAYLDFSGVASSLKNDHVLGAYLDLYSTWSYSCSARPVYVHPVTSSWSVTGDKSSGPSTSSPIGSASFAGGWVPLGSTKSPCPNHWHEIGLDQAGTNMLNGWTHGTTADNGLALTASGSDSYGWKKFWSDSGSTGKPFLAITYTTDGAAYKLASGHAVTNVTPSSAGTVAVTVKNTGSKTWTPSNGYEMSYTACPARDNCNAHPSDLAANHPVFTPMPSSVAPGQSVTVDVKVNALPAGSYKIIYSMYSGATGSSPVSFASQGIQDLQTGLTVPNPPPVVADVYPPTGFVSSTLRQQLSTSATADGTLTYDFTLTCAPLSGQTCTNTTVDSGSVSNPYWAPPAAKLDWDTPYTWKVVVTSTSGSSSTTTTVKGVDIEFEPPQPVITSNLGGSNGQAYDPLSGNYTTSATDAAVKVAGPSLEIDRIYNSMDPRTSEAFGAGWATVADTSLDNEGSTVLVTMPSGQEMRFGENGDGSYAPPFGSPDALKDSSGTWTLRDSSGTRYTFNSSGQLTSIKDQQGLAQDFAYNSSNQLSTITDATSGRALTLTWSAPSGASSPHVASVTVPPVTSGDAADSWTYTYSGDKLTQACAPASVGSGCTSYTYGSGSDYEASVRDASPRDYWQFGDSSGTSAADEVDASLGTADGTYNNVTLGAAGPLAGSSETAASFNGTSSYVSLPNNLMTDGTDVSVGLWFKVASGQSGVLFGYSTGTIASGSAGGHHVPALYVGANGELYGEFWNGSVDPIHTSSSVADGTWHYAVLSANSSSQTLYLDGAAVQTLSGQVDQQNMKADSVGAGYWNGTNWPENTQGGTATTVGYLNGDIGQVAVYSQPLSAATVASQYALGSAESPELTKVNLPSGKTDEQASYDPDTARLATYTDSNGGQWTIGQPEASGTKSSSDALGYVVENVTVADPAGHQEQYEYDMTDGGRQISYDNGVDPPQDDWYDAAGFLTSTVNPDGDLVCLTNDVHGNVLTRTWSSTGSGVIASPGPGTEPASCGGSTTSSPDCPSSGACTTFYSYYYNAANPLDPQNDELLTVRDGRSSSATDTTYETQYSYNSTGQMTAETTPPTSAFPNGRTTRYGYTTGTQTSADGGLEPAGLLFKKVTPGGATTLYTYDANGDLAQETEPSGRYTTYAHDGLGRATSSTVYTSTDSSGAETTYTYTPTGKKSVVTYPAVKNSVTGTTHQQVDTYTYDADDNLLSLIQTDATGNDPARTTSYTYNDHDQVATATQPAGATTGGSAQTTGASSSDPEGATTAYDYDVFGNVTQKTDPNGNQYRYQYNEYQDQTQESLYTASSNAADSTATCTAPATQDSDGGCDLVLSASTYDPAGLLAATTDAMGRITNNDYDQDQELIESSTTQACSTSAPCTSVNPCTPTAQCTTGSVGTVTNYTYDGAGNMTIKAVSAQRSGGDGQTTTTDYNYNADNQLASEVDDATPPGASSSSGYQNRTAAYTYNADGKVLSKTTGTGSAQDVTNYAYDTAGDKTSQTVVNGSTSDETTWTYDQDGQPLTETSPRGNASGATASDYTTNFAYDQLGDLVTETGAPVQTSTYSSQTPASTRPVTTYGYDTFGDKTQVEDPDGNVTATAYDGDGRVTSVTPAAYTPPGGSASVTKPTAYSYDEAGNLASMATPAGTESFSYDALGDLTSKTDPQLPGQSAPGTWQYTFDADGEQLTGTDPLGNETQRTYDYFGNVATQTDALQNTTRFAYDYLGDKTMTDTPDGSVTTAAYDDLGELTSQSDNSGDTSTSSYDDQGNLAVATSPDGSSEQYGYDQAGNLMSVADYGPPPSGGGSAAQLRSESFGYDVDGNQISAKDWNGNTTDYAFNAADEVTSQTVPVTSSSSITTSYGYDAAGNRTSVTGGNDHTTWTTFNAWNLPESVVEPTTTAAPTAASTTWTTAYNASAEPSAVTEPGGVSLSYGYDPLGNILSESGAGASASTPDRSFTYDLDGRMASAASGSQAADIFTYYPTGDLHTASGPSGASSYTYNDDGLVASETSAAGTASYTYDGSDRLATETEPLTGSVMTWKYNADSNPASVSYATGGTAGPVETFGYDGLQREKSQTLTSASGTVLASESYGYDNDGNIKSESAGGGLGSASETFSYDEADRLASETAGGTTTSFGYDGDGNLTTDGPVTDTYNAQDQLTSSSSGSATTGYAYSLNGQLSSVTPSGGSAQSYSFDAYGDLASAGGVSYGYDALGRMVSRTGSSGTASPVSYLGTGDSIASDGTSNYTYDPSGNLTGEEAASGAAGAGSAVMTNVHGDVTGAFSPAAGTSSLGGSASYSPYGQAASSGPMPAAGYQGGYTDPATGLVYMNARWYNPATGGFVSSDTVNGTPVPSTVDGNPYAYANGNPLTNTDPTGHLVPGELLGAGLAGAGEAEADGGWTCGPWCWAGAAVIGFGVGATAYWLSSSSSGRARASRGRSTGPAAGNWVAAEEAGAAAEARARAQAELRLEPRGFSSGGGSGGGGGGGPYGGGNVWLTSAATSSAATPTGPCGIYACPPPPPPPPPQNCYAAGLCKPTAASNALKQHKRNTDQVTNTEKWPTICKQGRCVTEKLDSKQGIVNGTQPGASSVVGNTAVADGGTIFQQMFKGLGIPEAPEPETQLQLAAAGSGNGGRGTVTGTSPAPGESQGSIWKQLGIGCVLGAAGDVLSGREQGQRSGWQLGGDATLGCAAGTVGNLGGPLGGMLGGFLLGSANGVGTQMIGNRSWRLSPGDILWAVLADGGLGAGESWAGNFAAKRFPVDDPTTFGNIVSGDAGGAASGVCGLLDRLKVADC